MSIVEPFFEVDGRGRDGPVAGGRAERSPRRRGPRRRLRRLRAASAAVRARRGEARGLGLAGGVDAGAGSERVTPARVCRGLGAARARRRSHRRARPDLPAARAAAAAPDARADGRLRGDAPGRRRPTSAARPTTRTRSRRSSRSTTRRRRRRSSAASIARSASRRTSSRRRARRPSSGSRTSSRSYSGPNAQPEATPDAMYRLAALYEERAPLRRRSERRSGRDPEAGDRPLQARHPGVSHVQRARGHLLLPRPRAQRLAPRRRGPAGVAIARLPQPLPLPGRRRTRRTPDADLVQPMPQDHDDAFWTAWRKKYPTAAALKRGAEGRHGLRRSVPDRLRRSSPQPTRAARSGSEVRRRDLVAHRRLGVRPARPARRRGRLPSPPPSGTTTAQRARTRTRCSSRSRRSTAWRSTSTRGRCSSSSATRPPSREFVHLLNYTDEQEKLTGDPGADFRQEAYTYIAGSLDNFDFVGPAPRGAVHRPARHPRHGAEPRRGRGEAARSRSIASRTRASSRRTSPGRSRSTRRSRSSSGRSTSTRTPSRCTSSCWTSGRWTRRRPDDQNAIAEVYDLLAKQTKAGPERSDYEQKVLEARTSLSKYIGDAPWVDANKDNPVALQRAEELVRTGLKGAAVTHTRNGQAALEQADQTGDPKEKLRLTTYALQEYKLAAIGWLGYLKQDENAPDAYKSRYFYADALHNQVRLEVALHQFDPKHVPGADVAGDRDRRARRGRRPRLRRGRPVHRQRRALRRRPRRRRSRSRVPALAGLRRNAGRRAAQGPEARGVRGRQEGRRRRVPRRDPDVDEGARRVHPARAARARQAEPRRRLRVLRGRPVLPLRPLQSGGAALRGDLQGALRQGLARLRGVEAAHRDEQPAEERRAFAGARRGREEELLREDRPADGRGEARRSDGQGPAERGLRGREQGLRAGQGRPARSGEGRAVAQGRRDVRGGARRSARRTRTRRRPRSTRPSATSRSASSTRRSRTTRSSSTTTAARTSSIASRTAGRTPRARRRSARIPAEYKERIKYLGMAYDALSTTYYGFFAYQQAAESFGKIASNPRFDDPERANAARIAMVLYSNLGDRANMNQMYGDPGRSPGCTCRPTSAPRPTTSRRASTTASGTRRPGESAGNSAARVPGDREPRAVPRAEQGPARVGALRARVGVSRREDDAVGGRSGVPDLVQDDDRRLGVLQVVPAGGGRRGRQGRRQHHRRATRRTPTTAARPTSRSSTSR